MVETHDTYHTSAIDPMDVNIQLGRNSSWCVYGAANKFPKKKHTKSFGKVLRYKTLYTETKSRVMS